MSRSLFYFISGAITLIPYFASGLVELRAGLAIEHLDPVLELIGCVRGLALHFATPFACLFVGALLLGR